VLGLDAEKPVHATAVEPHVEQALLEAGDIVAGDQPGGHVGEDPVTQPPPGLVEGVVGLRTDDAVDSDPALLLELPDRAVGDIVELGRLGFSERIPARLQQAEDSELGPDLGDGGPDVAATVGALEEHRRGRSSLVGIGLRVRWVPATTGATPQLPVAAW
jgi:hypothetical protein